MKFLLNHLLEESAQEFPDKTAVIWKDHSISYGELDLISNKLAQTMIENGLRRGDRVGIYMNKSISSIIGIHGILKAGGTYVPLDPNAPAKRQKYIIQNCGIKCLLTSTLKVAKIKEMFPKKFSLRNIIFLDDENEINNSIPAKIINFRDVVNCSIVATPQTNSIWTDLAYILYTSGSTGTPKGVMISHLNSLNFVNWAFDTFKVHHGDVLSNHAPYHFDLSILDVFVAMKAGATLALVPEEISYFPYRLAEWIDQNKITIWYSVPSILSMMLRNGKLGRFQYKHLRTILFAGEVFPTRYLRKLLKTLPHVEYFNLYGPTETNVITYYQVEELDEDQINPIPIGKSCKNMEVFALDEKGNFITEPGIEGELYARGSNVAQGYWGDPEKTKDLFLANFKQKNFEEKVYRTGDIVKLDENGDYLFVGRRDHMIKSRGYRIEIGEIESALYNHPKIVEAAVIPIPDDDVGNRIKAFLSFRDNEEMEDIDIQKHCAQYLPKYMIPELIEIRKSLPKTSTGKVNKTLLSADQQS